MQAQYIKINKEGHKFYYKDREMKILHRTDGPAIEYAYGSKHWCIDDKRHREDGPAYEGADGGKGWFFNGKLHREDGPAVEYADGSKFWYLNGKQLSEEKFDLRTAPEVELTLDEIAARFGIHVSKIKIVKKH